MTTTTTADDIDAAILNISIFAKLEQAQSAHGIPHQDYAQYHAYCSNRLARLRRFRDVRTHLVHNPKYVEGVSGRRHSYCPRQLINEEGSAVIRHENVLWNVVFQAERAWAQALQAQQQQKNSRHAHVQRRLNKAANYAAEVLTVAKGLACSDSTLQEAQSYAAWMKGNAALEQKRYLDAYRAYKESRTILLDLASQVPVSDESRDHLALKDTFTTRANSVLKPLVRYCQHEARDQLEAADLKDDVNDETSSSRVTGTLSSSSEIVLSFRGKDIALDAYKDLAVLYLKMEDRLKNPTTELDETQFLQLLSDLDDALKWAQAEYSHYESLPSGPSVTARREELQIMSGYFQYQKLSIWRDQQEKLVSELNETAAIVHVYDTLLQNAQAMAALLEEADGGGENVEEDSFWLEAQAHLVRIRAFRCYYLARLYESAADLSGTSQDVLALLRHANQLAERAKEELAACDIMGADQYGVDLDALISKIEVMTCRVEAKRFLESSSQNSTSMLQTKRPLWLRLEDLDAGSVLVDDPPLPIPIPCKPVFYDIAFQQVCGSFPVEELDSYISSHDKQARSSKGRGLLGWFG